MCCNHLDVFHILIFFFQCSGDHRDLHSFPTRRSSDLRDPGAKPGLHRAPGLGHLLVDQVERQVAEPGSRSEEHTSELQSLAYLVCRLLLEKKKKNYITIQYHTTPS